MNFKELFDAVALLTPYSVLGVEKRRIGAAHDGGYVMLDLLRPAQTVFSYGLSWNIAFEHDLAERGHRIFMFDHTIEKLTIAHERFHWHKEGLAAETRAEDALFSLADHVARLAPDETDMILKLDVEGAEWEALAGVPVDLLNRFEQIVIELHDLRNFADPAWCRLAAAGLGKLARHFTLHHVHANNCSAIVTAGGLPVADVIEVSYVRKDVVSRVRLATPFPTHLDAPNDATRRDYPLWFFPFLPMSGDTDQHALAEIQAATALRLDHMLEQSAVRQELLAAQAKAIKGALPPPGRRLKILCVSVHPVLEYDETRLFESMGHQVFSLGFFFSRSGANTIRPAMPETDWHRHCDEIYHATGCRHEDGPERYTVSSAFCALFDVVIVHHNGDFIVANWDVLQNCRVVWRTIGQELQWAENKLRAYRNRGLRIVRWSPEESYIDGYIGADAIIRAAKNPEDWGAWRGDTARIITFNNNFKARASATSFEFHQLCVAGFPFDLYGLNNDGIAGWHGLADAAQQRELFQSHRIAFVTGTFPAPYTLGFVEAWMTGIPVVHVGRKRFAGGQSGVFEIDRLIVHGENGFLVDEVEEAQELFKTLLNDLALCNSISASGRASAIRIFGQERAAAEWSSFFESL
jgi:hypothetical protein